MNYVEMLRSQFSDRMAMVQKRPGIMQLILPLYHEDGDMVDIFLEDSPTESAKIRVCDHGLSLMRLSYSFDLNTPRKEEIFQRLLSEGGLSEDDGNLFIEAAREELYPAILQFAQTVAKVASMRVYKREVIQNLFYENLGEIVESGLARFHPQKACHPIPEHDEYEVDYCFNGRPRPIYLFGVNGVAPARLATMSCQRFLLDRLSFRSLIVLERVDILPKKDQARLMSVADKEFPSLEDFRDFAEKYLDREMA